MKRSGIDFAPPSLARTLAELSPLAILLAVGALGALAYCAHAVWQLTQQTDAVLIQQASAQRPVRRAAPVVVAPRVPLSGPQVDAVNRAVAQLNLPWRDLFDAIEATTPSNVALLSVEPDARKHVVRVLAEAANSDTMLAYIEKLKRHPFFELAVITHHEVNDKDANHPLRFQFDIVWKAQ